MARGQWHLLLLIALLPGVAQAADYVNRRFGLQMELPGNSLCVPESLTDQSGVFIVPAGTPCADAPDARTIRLWSAYNTAVEARSLEELAGDVCGVSVRFERVRRGVIDTFECRVPDQILIGALRQIVGEHPSGWRVLGIAVPAGADEASLLSFIRERLGKATLVDMD